MTVDEDTPPPLAPPPIIGAYPEGRVVRLSRKALIVIALVGTTCIGGALVYSLTPAVKTPAAELFDAAHRPSTDALAAVPKDYADVPKLGPPLPGDLGRPILDARARGVDVPPLRREAPPVTGGQGQDRETQRARLGADRDAARSSKLFLGTGAPRAPDTPVMDPAARPVGPTPIATSGGATTDGAASKQAFLASAPRDRQASGAGLSPSPSARTLLAGSIIPAALVTGIRSDLPGQVTAQVTENVYDSLTGQLLLVPQGSRLIGEYDARVSFGQDRVLLTWDRLILPDGRSIVLERAPAADPQGRSGLSDKVDQHWGGVAKAALVSTLLAIGSEAGASGDGPLLRALREGTANSVSEAGQQIVRRQLGIQPTLTVRPGYPLRVIVVRDLIFASAGEE